MALNTFKCKCLTPLHFKGLKYLWLMLSNSINVRLLRLIRNYTVLNTEACTNNQPMDSNAQLASSNIPIHAHFLLQVILTGKVGHTDLVFGV